MEGSLRASLAASGGSTNRMGRRRRSARDDRAALSQPGGGGELLPAARIAFLSPWRGASPAPASRLPASGARSSAVLLADRSACALRSEEHTSELQSLMRISYAVLCLKKKKQL